MHFCVILLLLPSDCVASAPTFALKGSTGSALVSISTGELLLKESFELEKK